MALSTMSLRDLMRRFAYAFSTLLLASGPAFAQMATCGGQLREIRFAAGASAGEMRGGVPPRSIDCYVIGARAGQQLDASITSVENNAVFQIYAPGWRDSPQNGPEGPALRGTEPGRDARRFTGPLPANGRYLIVVGNTRGGSDYRLRVAIR